MRRLVYVQQPIHEEAISLLAKSCEVALGFGHEARSIASVIEKVEGIVVRTATLTPDTVRQAPALRVIARHGVGVDNVPVEEARRRGIPVLIAPYANTRSVAEHVFSLALAVSRGLLRADECTRAGRFEDRDRLAGLELFGARLGVVGIGRIGAEVARIARDGFGMTVMAYSPPLSAEEIKARGAVPASSLEHLLSESDLVTLHVPLTHSTRGLIGAQELSTMPRGSILIHTARGGVVDEVALTNAVVRGHLRGAGIDVFDEEPPPKDHPFFSCDRLILTPHTAGLTRQAMRRMGLAAAQGVLDILDGADAHANVAERPWQMV